MALALTTVVASAADAGAPGAVLKVVPAGSAGYVVCNNVTATATAVDKYLVAIGADAMAKGAMPTGALAAFKQAAQLGDGFNATGGMALVLLDPQQFGVDVVKAIKGDTEQKMPLVFFVAGSSVKELFSSYKMEEAGKFTKVHLRMGDCLATKIGDYVVFGEVEKAVQAVVDAQAGKHAADELGKGQAKLIDDTDFAIQVNMKVLSPIINSALKQAEEELSGKLKGGRGGEGGVAGGNGEAGGDATGANAMIAKVLPIYKDILGQLNTMTIGGRLTATGTVLDFMVAMAPDSMLGKAMAAFNPPGTPLLNQVSPDTYVLALGEVVVPATPEMLDMQSKAFTAMFTGPGMDKLPAETKDKLIALSKQFNEQTTSFQFVAGAAPEGSGLFGVSVVINCKDSDKMRALLEEACGVYQNVIRAAGGEKDADLKDFTITYNKALETVGDKKADAIDIASPSMATMDEKKRTEMKQVLGEDKIRLFVVPAAKDKVVLTFGGSKTYAEQAVKAANGAGATLTDKEAGDAAKYLPPEKERVAIMLFSPGNLFDLVKAGIKATAPGQEEAIPFNFNAKAPIVMGVGLSGASEHVMVFVPNEMIKQIVTLYETFLAPMQRGGPPAMGPDGF
jgi:hypothetical protein